MFVDNWTKLAADVVQWTVVVVHSKELLNEEQSVIRVWRITCVNRQFVRPSVLVKSNSEEMCKSTSYRYACLCSIIPMLIAEV